MNLQEIEQLITKYENGETSLQEEKELRDFFNKGSVSFEMRAYKEIFGEYIQNQSQVLHNPDFDEKVFHKIQEDIQAHSGSIKRRIYVITSIAAGLLIMFGFYFFGMNKNTTVDSFNDPAIAYAEAKKILMKVSGNLNTGMDDLATVRAISNGFNELQKIHQFNDGLKAMEKISILDKSKKTITQKN